MRCWRRPEPVVDLAVSLEEMVAAVCILPDADQACMRVSVVAIPEPALARLFGQVPEGLGDELDGRRGVGYEDEVEVLRVCPEEMQRLGPDLVDDGSGPLRRQIF